MDQVELFPSQIRPFTMFDACSVDQLKRLFKTFTAILGKSPSSDKTLTRKDDIIGHFIDRLSSEANLKTVYAHLNPLEQAAVQEAVASGKSIDWPAFQAKYGGIPAMSLARDYERDKAPAPLRLLLSNESAVSAELRQRLAAFVPAPKETSLDTMASLPDAMPMPGRAQDHAVPLVQQTTDQAAVHDVIALLRLVEARRIGVGEKSGRVSEASARTIRDALLAGDFYPDDLEAEDSFDVQMGSAGIRPFAWPMLLQAGGLAKTVGTKLQLTRTGQAALEKSPHDILRDLWKRWLETDVLHELNRIEVIKGQKAQSRPLAAPAPARHRIAEGLRNLPLGIWVSTEAFFKFLTASSRRFEVTRDPWALYMGDREYGSFGYDHVKWDHLEGRFARAFLLEYAASLGLIDVALTPPWGALDDLGDFWGADNLSCLSRYDGLRALRLNALGAWVLGTVDRYQPAQVASTPLFRILPTLDIAVTAPQLPPADRLFLERLSAKTSDRVWRLSDQKILSAREEGIALETIETFLIRRNEDAALPETVATFLNDLRERAERLRDAGLARLIQCIDAPTAALISNDPRLRPMCLPAGPTHVAVYADKEEAFRRTVRTLGYGVLEKK